MTLLLLRGPQTPGELRGRSDRLYPFDTPAAVEAALADLAAGEEPLVVELERAPGQKEHRWAHRVGAPAAGFPAGRAADRAPATERVEQGESALERLARRVDALEAEVAELRRRLDG
jgi:uncharacterized protein YceH (UPF0502 family)